ncbi:hypothetical protein KI387_010598, partial [Taxus chinensis]
GKRRTNELGTCGTRKYEVRDLADSDDAGKRRTNEPRTCGTRKREVRGSAESDENGTIGPGELGTFWDKKFRRARKEQLRVNR